jgi:hypothetical protein
MKAKLTVLALAGVVFSGLGANAATLDFVPSSSAPTVGTPVDIALRISGLGAGVAPSLGTYDITLAFDPVILGFKSFTFGDPTLGDQLDWSGSGTAAGFDGSVAGSLNVYEVSFALASDLDTLQAAQFILGTVSFDTLSTGTSSLGIGSYLLGDAVGQNLVADLLGSASITVRQPGTPVPDPVNTAQLLVLCLLGLRAWSRHPGWRR